MQLDKSWNFFIATRGISSGSFSIMLLKFQRSLIQKHASLNAQKATKALSRRH